MNTKLHAITDANGRPLSFFMTAGQVRSVIISAQPRCSTEAPLPVVVGDSRLTCHFPLNT